MTLDWTPVFSPLGLMSAALCILALLAYGLWKRIPGLIWRVSAMLLMLLWLSGPQIAHPLLRPQPQEALLVVDQSPSMSVRDRHNLVERAVNDITAQAGKLTNLHLHRVDVSGGNGNGTQLFQTIEREALNYPNLTGVFLLTDGMNHDTPPQLPSSLKGSQGNLLPLHLLLTAKGEEVDRRLRVLNEPPYVIVGQEAHIRLQVDDLGTSPGQPADIMEHCPDGSSVLLAHSIAGQPVDLTIPITHVGDTMKDVYVTPRSDDVSTRNNSIVLRIHGVRDRLRVLLVSGVPNQAARVWRQLLKADPSVDLVHFTILRSPDTEDDTPISDLALIPFPTHELFEQKIRSFDLIILDGFRNQNILPDAYLANIANYVRKGGGLLVTAGPEMLQDGSLQDTSLRDVLPAHIPSNGMITEAFHPRLTPEGEEHPVTSGLPRTGPWGKEWGSWYRALKPDQSRGTSLLATPHGSPLLLLNHVDQGRVAMMLTDQAWLWSRGEQGGGPQAELLRRLSHWLMKEPDLEENRLDAHINGQTLIVERHLEQHSAPRSADILTPSGTHQSLMLTPQPHRSVLQGALPLSEEDTHNAHIWTIHQDALTAFAASGDPDPVENADLRSTAHILGPLVTASSGGIYWLDGAATPTIRSITDQTALHGPDWMGLPRHQITIAGATRETPLLPSWGILPVILLLLALGWWREGR
ncbi:MULTISPECIES: VWA domain-containing protein [unclassified Saccharibacter]|uniref:VWA domain-containing protein n=1 Tax=unclassified Saccharibacter TaxID=2648722 RepID=UPI00132B820A|nr:MULTISPECIES: VWA domain-containing protein [unclassified Saccharibacter]MXV35040.1 VWA domain-containing protein [Saccharibacter sp. EH611]MXV57413.1 VWA domain-containing protein [Saccharibacter sp. EH70]MXV64726.1 VWA domain-containing protein [Saccharibacter sp. EH60]